MPEFLIGVGVGPGDPDLVTVKAVRALREAGTILVPQTEQSQVAGVGRAEATVLAHLDPGQLDRIQRVVFPMRGPRTAQVAAAAQAVVAAFAAGRGPVVFATIGDPSVYSTFGYLAQVVAEQRPDTMIQVIPGIMAMQALAASARVPLCEGEEVLTLVPATADPATVSRALRYSDTVVAYKAGRQLPQLLSQLSSAGRIEHTVVGSDLGLPEERIFPATGLDAETKAPYLTCVISTPDRATPDRATAESSSGKAGKAGKVWFIGAGPGAVDLITVRGAETIGRADIVIWASSLVNPKILDYARKAAELVDSASLPLEGVEEIYQRALAEGLTVARVHTGDPALWGAVQEQRELCDAMGLAHETIPGVTAVSAVAALVDRELTAPEISQSVVLTRLEGGRTPMPPLERVREFAAHQTTMALYLSVARSGRLQEELLAGGYPPDTPCVIAHAATWPQQVIIHCTVADLEATCKEHKFWKHTLVLVGRALDSSGTRSHLYHPGRFHTYRKADPDARRKLTEADGTR